MLLTMRSLIVLQLIALVSCFNLLDLAHRKASTDAHLLIARDDDDKNTTTSSNQPKTTSSSISIDPALPPGGVNLKTPASTSSTYIKSGAKVTFGWNYTSLSVTPSAINVEVSCSQNSQVYTLAHNQSVKSSSIVWDTNKATEDGGLHLISAEYTLVIYDAAGSASDVASAGMLSAFDYTFGVYLPQKYTPWPRAAKYVNISVRVTPPVYMSLALAAISALVCYLI